LGVSEEIEALKQKEAIYKFVIIERKVE